VVRHPPGLAPGEQGQVAALTPEQARALLSPEGRAAVEVAAQLDLSPGARVRAAEAVRPLGPLGPLALEQAILRERARGKHPRGDELWWTGPALEQASSYDLAGHRARRYDRPVLDLCCSVGGDLLRKQLKLTGSREVTVVLTRAAGRQVAMVVRPTA
jgi:hypothetical protein